MNAGHYYDQDGRLFDVAGNRFYEEYQPETTPSGSNSPGQGRTTPDGLNLIRGDTIKPEAIGWIWYGWLAAGKVHVLGGSPGTGKTTIALSLAATITTGGCWPDGTRAQIGNVAIWSGEDDPRDTLIPRLALMGADLRRVYFVGDITENLERRAFDPANDIELLRLKLAEIGDVRLLIIDPIVSAITGDSHKNAEVRRGLQPLSDLAATLRCALLGITHFTKGTAGRDPVERITGSLAFGAVARIVMVAAKQQETDGNPDPMRLLCRAKSNIGRDDGGFEYGLNESELSGYPGVTASGVQWGRPVEGAARDLLAVAETADDGSDGGGVDDWLTELLREEGGSVDRRDVMKAARAMGYPERTVYRARERIGATTKQIGYGKAKLSLWEFNLATTSPILPIMPRDLCGKDGKIDTRTGNHDDNKAVTVFADDTERF